MDYSKLRFQGIERLARSINPGTWAVESERPLSTLLGSCVAVCLVDSQTRIGGLNHFMLPNLRRNGNAPLDALLFGSHAMEALLDALLQRGARKERLQAKAFGGGTIIDSGGESPSIGLRNAEFAKEWLARQGIPLLAADFLGPWSRKVLFLPITGEVFCRRLVTSMATAEVIAREEASYAAKLISAAKFSAPLLSCSDA
ncbi:chemotaxis protein CheD [Dechloromonas sp. A34]|uniref:chemotaxis protein CheD n=1 Tax=Dechloromonas sp. A34 TaxID=447588 RepID=UPI00224991FA|nr:chemotaxis protein CheD [Dechloromonas sp. A34]